jgi:hypothetical protein
VTVLGRGDLSPPRRHRGRGPILVAIVVAGLLATAGWFGWHALRGGDSTSRQTVRTCVTPTPAPTPARPADVTVAVFNATPKVGLAHQVAAALRARGFRIGRVGNTKAIIGGTAVVTYGPGGHADALAVAEQVSGATVTPVPAGTVTLELGPAFTGLAAPADVTAAKTRDVAAASPRPAVCTSS